MTKPTVYLVLTLALLVMFTVPALAQDTHNAWSTKPLYLGDGATGLHYSAFVSGDASLAWTEATPRAYAHALAIVTPSLKYDFMLVSTTSSDSDAITGRWNVRRNGVLVCANCIGKAYGLSQPVSNYFKIYIGTPAAFAEKWHYSGYITNRFDF